MIGECVEEIRIEVVRRMLRKLSCVLSFWVDLLKAWMGRQVVCVDGDGASYWMLICRLVDGIKEIKSPCCGRGFRG